VREDKIKIINKLVMILNKYGDADNFFQLMLVYERVKPGFLVQYYYPHEKKVFKREIVPLLKELGFYVSFKHQGYVTFDKKSYKSWNGFRYYIHKNKFASHYLGYPKYCEEGTTLNTFSLSAYHILKRIVIDKDQKYNLKLKEYLKFGKEIEWVPCTLTCHKTYQKAIIWKKVYNEFSQLMPNNFSALKFEIAKERLKNYLKNFSHIHQINKMKKALPLLKSKRATYGLSDDFFDDIEEFINNPNMNRLAELEAYVKGL
jgi:hypothetical protein